MADEFGSTANLDAMRGAQQAFSSGVETKTREVSSTQPTAPQPGIVGKSDSVFKMGGDTPSAPTQSKFSMFGNPPKQEKPQANPLDGLTGVLKNQYDSLFKTAMDAASARVNGVMKPPVEMPPPIDVQTLMPPKAEVKNAQGESVPVVGGAVAQKYGVTLNSGFFGADKPSYVRNGVQIELPSDIDLNDDKAVQAKIDELENHFKLIESVDNDDNGWN